MTDARDVPVLSDGVVTLRAHSLDDVPGIVEQCRDALTIRWTTVPLGYAADDARRFVQHAMPGGWADDVEWGWAVEAPDDDGVRRFAGSVSLRNEGEHRAEVAYGAHPWARGRGVMERALRLMLSWGFAHRDLQTVVWWANQGNWASRRLAWRLGFTIETGLRRWLPQRGELQDAWAGTLLTGQPQTPAGLWFVPPVIDGPRVRLRPLAEKDVDRIVEGCSDPVSQRWLGQLPAPYHAADARAFIAGSLERQARGTAVTWAVSDPDSHVLIGMVDLFDIRPGVDAEVGFWMHPEARGRRLGVEACRLALRHAVVPMEDGGLGLGRVRAVSAEENGASRRLLEAAGLRLQGRERRLVRVREAMADAAVYDVLAEEVTG